MRFLTIALLVISFNSFANPQQSECQREIKKCQKQIATLQSALDNAQGESAQYVLEDLLSDAKIRCSEKIKEACQ